MKSPELLRKHGRDMSITGAGGADVMVQFDWRASWHRLHRAVGSPAAAPSHCRYLAGTRQQQSRKSDCLPPDAEGKSSPIRARQQHRTLNSTRADDQ
jgi:hypothetical protein